jgi:hypothetical protein
MLFRRSSLIRHGSQYRTKLGTRRRDLRERLDSHTIHRCWGRLRRRGRFNWFGDRVVDFTYGEEACVGEDVWADDDGTDAETGGYVLGGLGGVFSSSTGGFPDFGEVVALNPEFS